MTRSNRDKGKPTIPSAACDNHSDISLMPATFIEMPEEDAQEVVDLLADILIDVIRIRMGLPPLYD